jgi:hypothetical protein
LITNFSGISVNRTLIAVYLCYVLFDLILIFPNRHKSSLKV